MNSQDVATTKKKGHKIESRDSIPSNGSNYISVSPLDVDHGGDSSPSVTKESSGNANEQQITDVKGNQQLDSSLTLDDNDENAGQDEEETTPQALDSQPPSSSVKIKQTNRKESDPLLTSEAAKENPLSDSAGPQVNTKAKTQPKVDVSNKKCQHVFERMQTDSVQNNEPLETKARPLQPISSEDPTMQSKSSGLVGQKLAKRPTINVTKQIVETSDPKINNQNSQKLQEGQFSKVSNLDEVNSCIFDDLLKEIIQKELTRMLGETLMDAASQEDSEADMSEYFKNNLRSFRKLESQNSIDFSEMDIINRLRYSTSIKVRNQIQDQELEALLAKMKIERAGKLTRENTIEDQMNLRPIKTQQSSDSVSLPKDPSPHLPPMKKNHSHYTSIQLHKLQTGITKEKEEIQSDSDYRSAYSQALHNDFELLQSATARQRFQILIKAQGNKNDKKRNEVGSAAKIDPDIDAQIPNIFENKDSILSGSMQTSESGSPPSMAEIQQRMPYAPSGLNIRYFVYPNADESHPSAASGQFAFIQNQSNVQFLSNLSESNNVVNLNQSVQTDVQDTQAAPAPISISTQTPEEFASTRYRRKLAIENVITDFTLDPWQDVKIHFNERTQIEIQRSADKTANQELNSEISPKIDEPARIEESEEISLAFKSPSTYKEQDQALLEINSSSENSGTSFELMAYEAEREIEEDVEEPDSPSHFLLNGPSPETSKSCESRWRSNTSPSQAFKHSLGVVCKDNPRILINRIDSSCGNTPTELSTVENTLRQRGQNSGVNALPMSMTFADLSPDEPGSATSPGTKRARAQTFNIDDDLIITKYPCEPENENNPIQHEEYQKTKTVGSDCNKNLIKGQEKYFNTKTPISQFDSTTDSSQRQDQQAQLNYNNQTNNQSLSTTTSIGMMQGNTGATTFNKNYKVYSQSPQFQPTIRRPLDSPYQPLPAAIKKPEKSSFLGGVLNDSPAGGDTNNAQRDFYSGAKEGSLSAKAETRTDTKFEPTTFQRTLTEREEENTFKEDQLLDRKENAKPVTPNLLFQPQSSSASKGGSQLDIQPKQSARTEIGHSSAAPPGARAGNELDSSHGSEHQHVCPYCRQALPQQPNGSPRTSLVPTMQSSYTPPQRRVSELGMIPVVEFEDQKQEIKSAEAPKYNIVAKPQEVWPFIETGRQEKTFDQVRLLGEGAFGSVFQVKHKLDEQIYALKKIQMHLQFDPSERPDARKRALLSHPAMKEIEAISKLSHKNIVGYKGCWVEAGQPNATRINRIQAKQLKRKMRRITNGADLSLKDGIDERDDDDSEWEFDVKENEELNAPYEKNSDQIYNDDSDSNEGSSDSRSFHSAKNHSDSESYYSESEDEEEASDCASDASIYQLVDKKESFASLNVMILMEYAEGETLRDRIDKSGSKGLDRKVIYQLFEQLMQALKYIHAQGLIHRDIKPENIFVNPNTGRLQVGDFGLAKRVKTLGEAPEAPSFKHVRSSAQLPELDNMYTKSKVNTPTGMTNPFQSRKNNQLSVPSKETEASCYNPKDDSSDGNVGGTLMYLSPEMRPQPKQVGKGAEENGLKTMRALQLARTQARDKVDIYAAGLVLFEMCGNFTTDMERINAYDGLQKRREFPKGFTDKFYQESQIISMMTEPLPQKRPSASFFLNKSPEFQCYGFDLKVKDLI